MTFTKSLSLICPASSLDAANLYMEQGGRGPGTFSVPLSSTGAEPASHYGAHTFDDDLLDELRVSGDAEALGIEWLWAEARTAVENFGFLVAFHGLKQVVQPG